MIDILSSTQTQNEVRLTQQGVYNGPSVVFSLWQVTCQDDVSIYVPQLSLHPNDMVETNFLAVSHVPNVCVWFEWRPVSTLKNYSRLLRLLLIN